MGIFSGIFGDSEKDSKTEINVVNVYENKNNPQGRKIFADASKRMPTDFKLTEEQAQELVNTMLSPLSRQKI